MTKAQRRELKRSFMTTGRHRPLRAYHAVFLNSAASQRQWGYRIFARRLIDFARDARAEMPRLP